MPVSPTASPVRRISHAESIESARPRKRLRVDAAAGSLEPDSLSRGAPRADALLQTLEVPRHDPPKQLSRKEQAQVITRDARESAQFESSLSAAKRADLFNAGVRIARDRELDTPHRAALLDAIGDMANLHRLHPEAAEQAAFTRAAFEMLEDPNLSDLVSLKMTYTLYVSHVERRILLSRKDSAELTKRAVRLIEHGHGPGQMRDGLLSAICRGVLADTLVADEAQKAFFIRRGLALLEDQDADANLRRFTAGTLGWHMGITRAEGKNVDRCILACMKLADRADDSIELADMLNNALNLIRQNNRSITPKADRMLFERTVQALESDPDGASRIPLASTAARRWFGPSLRLTEPDVYRFVETIDTLRRRPDVTHEMHTAMTDVRKFVLSNYFGSTTIPSGSEAR